MLPLGVAVIGTGFIGPVHVEAVRRLGHRVRGMLGSTPEKSQAAAESLGLECGYRSLDELLADSAVHVVHVASPNRDHAEQARRCLLAGKHVVCEKPLAMTSQQTSELVRLAEASSLVAAVNYNVRFYPLVLEVRERIRRGDIGEIFHVSGSYFQDWLLEPTDFNWRVLAEHGGELRAIADIGTHWLDTIQFIAGLELEAVCADLRTVHPIRQRPNGSSETFSRSAGSGPTRVPVKVTTEDYGSILLRFRGGAKGCMCISQVVAGRKNGLRFDLAGSKASLNWDSEEPNALGIGHRHSANERLTRDPALLSPAARGFADYPGGHAEGFPDSFKQLYKAIYSAIQNPNRGAVPEFATFADGHREVVICEAILKSHREERWVRVGE
jgi:predicted dehydrogenase